MTDYRSTVHVPVTSFPMRGDLLNRQEEILARWQAQDLYRAILEDRRDAQPFIIHDGPPYASGQVHVGIGLNKILKDVVAKFHSMRDRRVPFVPGWDCHGLPIEPKVMKLLDRRRALIRRGGHGFRGSSAMKGSFTQSGGRKSMGGDVWRIDLTKKM